VQGTGAGGGIWERTVNNAKRSLFSLFWVGIGWRWTAKAKRRRVN